MEEIEVKFLNIDVAATEAKLRSSGAKKLFDRLYRRRVYDYPDLRLNAKNAWIRVRDEGDQVTLGFKQRQGNGQAGTNDSGMKEVEIVVSDFDKTSKLLEAIGLKEKFYEENRRVRWSKDNINFDIDHWPMLQPYLEIEASSWKEVNQGIALLGLDPKDQKRFATMQVYALEGINELDYKVITFDKQLKNKPAKASSSK
jgi:adenylate cyclase class 2